MSDQKLTKSWSDKLTIKITEEDDGGIEINIDWDPEDPDLEYWTNLGEEGQKSFIIDTLTNAVDCYVY
jgi:hypothetical protein